MTKPYGLTNCPTPLALAVPQSRFSHMSAATQIFSLATLNTAHQTKRIKQNCMKKLLISALIGLSAVTLLTGCAWSLGSGSKTVTMMPTAGQQLIDLQKARNTGAISDAEYQTQKAKILGSK